MIKFNWIVLIVFLIFAFVNLYFKKHHSECLFKVVKCPNSGCTKVLSKQKMKLHETSFCSWRKVNCEYCQESVIMNQKQVCRLFYTWLFNCYRRQVNDDLWTFFHVNTIPLCLQKHVSLCREFPVQCTNKCGLRDIPRKMVSCSKTTPKNIRSLNGILYWSQCYFGVFTSRPKSTEKEGSEVRIGSSCSWEVFFLVPLGRANFMFPTKERACFRRMYPQVCLYCVMA